LHQGCLKVARLAGKVYNNALTGNAAFLLQGEPHSPGSCNLFCGAPPRRLRSGLGGFYDMELDVRINGNGISIGIENPYRLDLDGIVGRIDQLFTSRGAKATGLDIKGLLPRMVKGIAGCEAGCPANAKSLVERGYENFTLQYVEGGILTATAKTPEGENISLKLFPDF
jgi:hypothetical protein